MISNAKVKNLYYIASINLICFYIADVLFHLRAKMEWTIIRPTLVIKSIFLVLFMGSLFFAIKKNIIKKGILIYFSLIAIFIIERLILYQNIQFGDAIYLIRYTYIIPAFLFYETCLKDVKYTKQLVKIIEIIFIFNGVLIIIGFLFELDFFKRYDAHRFGYTGFFPRDSITYLTCLMIIYYIKKITDNRSVTNILLLFFTLAVGFLTGTKTIYLFILILFFYFFNQLKKRDFLIIISLGIAFLTIFAGVFKKILVFFQEIYNESGLLNALTSYRYRLVKDIVSKNTFIENLKIFFFGGVKFNEVRRPEMEMIDIILFIGIFGLIIILYFYYKFLYVRFKTKENKLILVSLLILGFFTSNFIHNINLSIWLIIFLGYYYNTDTHKNTQIE